MDSNRFVLETLRKDITEHNLQIRALIQDINACVGPLADLQHLNTTARSKISALRKFIDKFNDIAVEHTTIDFLKDVLSYREQLASTMVAFKEANIKCMQTIEKGVQEELLKPKTEEMVIRQRQKRDKENLVKMSSNVTEQLLSISRQLADTTKRSADTLDALAASSDSVIGAQEELKLTSSTISQSGKLLAKYGRRECTDKILMFFAFVFFISCVFYIVQKRLF